MIVAEFTPDGNFLLQFIGTIGFIALVISKVFEIFTKKTAQKREVSFSEEFARRDEVTRIERHVEKLEGRLESALESIRSEMKEDRTEILKAGEERAVKLHERINVVLGAVERTTGVLVGRAGAESAEYGK